jgi:hypothetical protein
VPQPHRPMSEAERVRHFERLEEQGRRHAETWAEVGRAEQMVRAAVWRLAAAISSDSPGVPWERVWSELGQAIRNLTATSTHLMRLDDNAVRAEREAEAPSVQKITSIALHGPASQAPIVAADELVPTPRVDEAVEQSASQVQGPASSQGWAVGAADPF